MRDSVLITGAGSGIGLASALTLATAGFTVYASTPDLRQQPEIETEAARNGVSLRVLQVDVTQPASIAAAVETIVNETGNLYALVNSAGLGLRGFFEDLADAEIRQMFDVNVFGTMAAVRAVLPVMRRQRRGRIVMVTSAGGRVASMTISAYCAGKFALEGFGESLALEVAPFGVQVSLIEPGLVMTPHFTEHRGRAQAAMNPASRYYPWFLQHEAMVDRMLRTSGITPAEVAEQIRTALTARRPRLRYIVGKRAKLLINVRRYLPDALFQPIYTRYMTRTITRPRRPAAGLNDLALPAEYLGLNAGARSEPRGELHE